MAVLPKKYSKRGPISLEDYIIYMTERIEQDSRVKDQKIAELTTKCEEQAKMLAELKKITRQEI
jgi:hypothetical protein